MNELPPPRHDWALFLDFDGTLVELQEQPGAVTLPPAIARLLGTLYHTFAGAVAIISGRTITDLDHLLKPLRLPLAGLHGLERRNADQYSSEAGGTAARLDAVRGDVATFAAGRAGVLVEDKGAALALHYRGAPQRAAEVAAFLEKQCSALGDGFQVQPGKSVFELKPEGQDKGSAIRAFMAEPPFAGRIPVYLGDDRTDEHAFAAVNALGGLSICVGPANAPTEARHALESTAAVVRWLDTLAKSVEISTSAQAGSSATP